MERSRLLEAVDLDEVHDAVLEHHDHLRRVVVHRADHTEVRPPQTNVDSLSSSNDSIFPKVFLTTAPYFGMFVLVGLVWQQQEK